MTPRYVIQWCEHVRNDCSVDGCMTCDTIEEALETINCMPRKYCGCENRVRLFSIQKEIPLALVTKEKQTVTKYEEYEAKVVFPG